MVTTHLPSCHTEFPSALLDLPSAGLSPCQGLYIRGAWPPKPGVAIVGTRQPTREAAEFARALAECVIRAGWTVWSGGARGIDGIAHEAALAAGGPTVMVSPSGLDAPYPPEHAPLFERIAASGGTLLSPFEDSTPPKLTSFFHRNAVLAALTVATVVVQAPLKSGARSTASAARKLGRPLFVVPHAPWEERGAGCALELELGARPLVDRDTFIAALRAAGPPAQLELPIVARAHHAHEAPAREAPAREARTREARTREARTREARTREASEREVSVREASHAHAHAYALMSDEVRCIFDAIDETPAHPDELCERTSLPIPAVTAALLTLTLQAVVVEAPAGLYRRAAR